MAVAMESASSVTRPPMRHPEARATSRSHRGLSKKLQGMMKKRDPAGGGAEDSSGGGKRMSAGDKFEARNWKQMDERKLATLTTIERSRYMAYEPAPKEMQERSLEALKRVREATNTEEEQLQGASLDELIERERNSELMGQLRAAEAGQRIRLMKLRERRMRAEELAFLTANQPSAVEAVRLKTFVPPYPRAPAVPELLNRHEHIRCEALLEDDKGLMINRTT